MRSVPANEAEADHALIASYVRWEKILLARMKNSVQTDIEQGNSTCCAKSFVPSTSEQCSPNEHARR